MAKQIWLCPDSVFDNGQLVTDMAVPVSNCRAGTPISLAEMPRSADCLRIAGTLAPGFVDLQVNGGGGVLVNDTPTVAGMLAVATAHRRFGTAAIMPTIISDRPEVMRAAAAALIAQWPVRGLIGLHIEGPHIAVSRRGTHAAEFLRPMDAESMSVLRDLRKHDIPVMLTLAPEVVTEAQIAALAQIGVIVSLGHSDATAEMTERAFAAGARAVTHLFNAMSQMQGRAPGLTGAAINSDCHIGIICDGHHVSDAMVGLALRARPVQHRMFLVSDAMPTVGGPDHFMLYGQRITVVDGKLINAAGALAGAHITQAGGVRRLVHHVGVDLATALGMAISVPAGLIGRGDLAQVSGRDIADLVVVSSDAWQVDLLPERMATK